ncbi:hypothetical protein [Endozoicomonas sp. ALE010]|uniref:hypothetical protein n=1 Tax=Endozoicomonas sp. ALE010 TaxID=3403081 RepID=UPI003BB532F0
MSSVNPNSNIAYSSLDIADSKNDQPNINSSKETSASFNSKNINTVKETSSYSLLSSAFNLTAGAVSSLVSLANRVIAGTPPSYEETIKNDAKADLDAAIAALYKKPVPDEIVQFLVEELAKPSRDKVRKALLENMEGFDKLDEATQNQLVEQGREIVRNLLFNGDLEFPEITDPSASQNTVSHRRPQSLPLS